MPPLQFSGPLYAVCQREAVEVRDGTPLCLDSGFLRTMVLTELHGAPDALLLFTNRDKAQQFLGLRNDSVHIPVTFATALNLVELIETGNCEWIVVNREPGQFYGHVFSREELLRELRRWLAEDHDDSTK